MSQMTLQEFQESHKGPVRKGVLVMDGDWLVYQAMAASEIETDWGDDVWTLECDHAKARNILEDSINSYRTRKKAWAHADVVLAFTHAVNWRKELVDPTYKENRKASRKPVGYRDFVSKVIQRPEYISILEDNLEGDDVMGIIGSNPLAFGYGKAVLISCDKDFKTIPDCDFLWCTTGNILQQDLKTADYWHMFQTIKGDTTDGYSGIAGWGDTAADFLAEPYVVEQVEKTLKSGKNKGEVVTQWVKRPVEAHESLWDCIKSIGAKVGMTEDDIIAQARMARILRYTDYNIDTGEIHLWEPNRTTITGY